jgi:hypothetical protein
MHSDIPNWHRMDFKVMNTCCQREDENLQAYENIRFNSESHNMFENKHSSC